MRRSRSPARTARPRRPRSSPTSSTQAGLDPTVITGGIINDWGSNARLGEGQWMIVEADESDGTFIKLPTQIGVVTNIDPEHLDYFGTVENMHREFEAFYRNIPFYGLAVTCIDHPVVREMIERLELRRDGRRLLTYGTDAGRRPRAEVGARRRARPPSSMPSSARACTAGRASSSGWSVPMPGASQRAQCAGGDRGRERGRHRRRRDPQARWPASPASSAASSSPARGTASPIYDDYGHHPVEIAAVLKAARGRRARARHRRGRAASLHARARPVRRVRRLLQGRRQRHRRAALFGRRSADRRHRPALRWPRHPRHRAHGGVVAVDSEREHRAGAQRAVRGRATWWSASAPATRPNGRTRCPDGCAASRCASGGAA